MWWGVVVCQSARLAQILLLMSASVHESQKLCSKTCHRISRQNTFSGSASATPSPLLTGYHTNETVKEDEEEADMEAFGPDWLAFGSVVGGESPTASVVGSLGQPLLQASFSTMWQQQVSSMQRPRQTSRPSITQQPQPVPSSEQARLSQVMLMA